MLQEEALIIAEKLGIEGFASSNGWLESFKKTQNISTMSVAGEEGDVTSMTLESWKERSRELIYSRGGDSYMEQTGMLVGNFEFNP